MRVKATTKILFLNFVCGIYMAACCIGATFVQVALDDIDSGSANPTGNYRWRDVADHLYAESYRNDYNYIHADVRITYCSEATSLFGTLYAVNLKPNFAYQFKLTANPGTETNEAIGLTGRWWQQEWDGSNWSGGKNLNDKGDGSSPNPNDRLYFDRRDVNDINSPTGKHYRFSGYLVFAYFVTDPNGSAEIDFTARDSYHVLWKTSQRTRTIQDGPLEVADFAVSLPHVAYDTSYPRTEVSVFGEWERLPVGGVTLPEGAYEASFLLTEESFHSSGGTYAGLWAAAMSGPAEFTILPCTVDFLHFARFSHYWLDTACTDPYWCNGADFDRNADVNSVDLTALTEHWLNPCPNLWRLK